MILPYNPKLKKPSRELRKNSTLSEVLLWNQLKGKKLRGFQFNRQKPIDRFIVDFYCKKLSLVIEIDGESHNEKQKEDTIRQKKLESYGLKVIRFYDIDVKKEMDAVLRSIEMEIEKLEGR